MIGIYAYRSGKWPIISILSVIAEFLLCDKDTPVWSSRFGGGHLDPSTRTDRKIDR